MKRSVKLSEKEIQVLEGVIKDKTSTLLELKRAQVVMLVDGEAGSFTIQKLTGYSEKHAYAIRRSFLEKGVESIRDKRKPAFKELLTKRQRAEIIETVREKSPNDCDSYYNSQYWTTGILGEFIQRNYKVQYKSRTSLYLIFRQSRFSFHKPGRVYEKRDEEKVKIWREEIRPILKRAFKDSKTVLLVEDEMVLSSQTTFQKIWLPQGEYPKIEVSNTKMNRSVYGFLNLKSGEEHAFKRERQNMFITAEILKEIRSFYPDKKVLVLWDGAGWHRGSRVSEFVREDGKMKTLYFPSYSPEENPQEHVWKKGRSQITHNRFIPNIDKATDDFVSYLNNTKFHYKINLGIET